MNCVIFVAQGVQDQEFWYPYYRLNEERFNVDVVAPTTNVTGKYGIPIKNVDYLTHDLKIDNYYNLIIVPGGWQAPEIMRQDVYITTYLEYANRQKILIGTICHGPQVLISANIVKDRHMTCYKGMKDDLINAGAKYLNQAVVIDNNIISAQHYDNNPEWMKAIIQQLNV